MTDLGTQHTIENRRHPGNDGLRIGAGGEGDIAIAVLGEPARLLLLGVVVGDRGIRNEHLAGELGVVWQVADDPRDRQRYGGVAAGHVGLSALALGVREGLADGIGVAEEFARRGFGQHHRLRIAEHLGRIACKEA